MCAGHHSAGFCTGPMIPQGFSAGDANCNTICATSTPARLCVLGANPVDWYNSYMTAPRRGYTDFMAPADGPLSFSGPFDGYDPAYVATFSGFAWIGYSTTTPVSANACNIGATINAADTNYKYYALCYCG